MAIDTAEKRKSISGIWLGLIPGMTNNATHDQEWRQESGWSYSGVLAAGGGGGADDTSVARAGLKKRGRPF